MKTAVVSLGHKENYLISVKRAITNMPLSLVTLFRLNMNSLKKIVNDLKSRCASIGLHEVVVKMFLTLNNGSDGVFVIKMH